VEVGILRLRGLIRFANQSATLRMTIWCLAPSRKSAETRPGAGSSSLRFNVFYFYALFTTLTHLGSSEAPYSSCQFHHLYGGVWG